MDPHSWRLPKTLGMGLCHDWVGAGAPPGEERSEVQGKVNGIFGDLGDGCGDTRVAGLPFWSHHVLAPCEKGSSGPGSG